MAHGSKRCVAALVLLLSVGIFSTLTVSAEEQQETDAAAYQTETTDLPASGWNRTEDGAFCYLLEDGSAAVGEVEIDGVLYLFGYSGALKTDWQTVGGKRCYFDPESGQAVFGWIDYFGSRYYVSPDEGKLIGTHEIDGETVVFDAQGVCMTVPIIEESVVPEYFEAAAEMPPVAEDPTEPAAEEVLPSETEAPEPELPAETQPPAVTAEAEPTEPETEPAETVLMDEVREDGTIELSVPDYKQKDPAWTSSRIGSATIGKVGCLVTSMAMMHTYRTGEPFTPPEMAKLFKFTSGGGIAGWNYITDLGYTVETYSCAVTPAILERIYHLLCEGKPVVLGSKGSGQHYVCITGYTGNGESFAAKDFLIHDPGYSRRFTLADHLAQYRTLYKLIYFP